MRFSASGVFIAVVLAGFPGVAPAQLAPAEEPAIMTESIQIKASAATAYRLAPQEFDQYAHPYLLDNGIVLQFHQRRRQAYTQLYNEAPVELFPLAPGKFVTALGATIEFKDDGDTIAVTHLDRMPYSGTNPISPDRVYSASR
ncbi:MAG: hypothetical protein V4724_21345 [Pseudomonadota bacterium]